MAHDTVVEPPRESSAVDEVVHELATSFHSAHEGLKESHIYEVASGLEWIETGTLLAAASATEATVVAATIGGLAGGVLITGGILVVSLGVAYGIGAIASYARGHNHSSQLSIDAQRTDTDAMEVELMGVDYALSRARETYREIGSPAMDVKSPLSKVPSEHAMELLDRFLQRLDRTLHTSYDDGSDDQQSEATRHGDRDIEHSARPSTSVHEEHDRTPRESNSDSSKDWGDRKPERSEKPVLEFQMDVLP